MISDLPGDAAERIVEAVWNEMDDVRTAIEDLATGIEEAIDTLDASSEEPEADARIADALIILRGLDR